MELREYQAGNWDRPRRIIAKCEVTETGGVNRRFVVTSLTQWPEHVYREVYVQRGDSPERAIEELKHGLGIDRLSSHRFFANAFQLQCHLLAYALYVLFREANAAVPEVAGHTLETVGARVLKVGAVVRVSTRKVWLRASATWPGRELFGRVCAAVSAYAERVGRLWGDRLAEGLSVACGNPSTIDAGSASCGNRPFAGRTLTKRYPRPVRRRGSRRATPRSAGTSNRQCPHRSGFAGTCGSHSSRTRPTLASDSPEHAAGTSLRVCQCG